MVSEVISDLEVPVRYDLLDTGQPGSPVRDMAWQATHVPWRQTRERLWIPSAALLQLTELLLTLRAMDSQPCSGGTRGGRIGLNPSVLWTRSLSNSARHTPPIATGLPSDYALDTVSERSAEGAPVVITPRKILGQHLWRIRFDELPVTGPRNLCGPGRATCSEG